MARTEITPKTSGGISGGSKDFTGTFTEVSATTGVMHVAGFPLGRVRNETAYSLVLRFLDAGSPDGPGCTTREENSTIADLSVPAWSSVLLPTGLVAMTYCAVLIVSGAVEAELSFHFER